MLQGRQTNAEGHHINKGITGQLLSPGGGIGQEVAADDLHQNAEAEACVEDGTQSVQDLHVDLDEFIQAFLHDLNLISGFTAASGQRCDSVVDLLLAVGQDGQHKNIKSYIKREKQRFQKRNQDLLHILLQRRQKKKHRHS